MKATNLYLSLFTKIIYHPSYKYSTYQHNSTLKNYFNKRVQLTNVDLVNILESLKNNNHHTYKIARDHRFLHLITRIQGNINKFGVTQKIRMAQALCKLKYQQSLLSLLKQNLAECIDLLTVQQLSILLSIHAKTHSRDIQAITKVCFKLTQKLKNPQKLVFSPIKQNTSHQTMYIQIDNNKSQQDINQQSIQKIQIKRLLDIIWSLHTLKITDKILTDIILKTYIRPNLQKIPIKLIPYLLVDLNKYNMSSKRIYSETIQVIKNPNNQVYFENLSTNKLSSLVCSLARVQDQKKLVLWLLQTLYLKLKYLGKLQSPISSYKLFANLTANNIYDQQLYSFIIQGILVDKQALQIAQIIKVLVKLHQINKNVYKNQIRQLAEFIWGKYHFLLNKCDQDHIARIKLRELVVNKKLIAPKGITKSLIKQDREIKQKNKNMKTQQNDKNRKKQQKQQQKKQ